jgi:hypothetical protein
MSVECLIGTGNDIMSCVLQVLLPGTHSARWNPDGSALFVAVEDSNFVRLISYDGRVLCRRRRRVEVFYRERRNGVNSDRVAAFRRGVYGEREEDDVQQAVGVFNTDYDQIVQDAKTKEYRYRSLFDIKPTLCVSIPKDIEYMTADGTVRSVDCEMHDYTVTTQGLYYVCVVREWRTVLVSCIKVMSARGARTIEVDVPLPRNMSGFEHIRLDMDKTGTCMLLTVVCSTYSTIHMISPPLVH